MNERVYGRVQVIFNPSFPAWPGGTPPDNFDRPFEFAATRDFSYQLVGIGPRRSAANAYHILGGITEVWYDPAFAIFSRAR